MSYSTLRVLYVGTVAVCLVALLMGLADDLGILERLGGAESFQVIGMFVAMSVVMLFFGGLCVAPVILWQFRRDWRAALPAAFFLAFAVILLGSEWAGQDPLQGWNAVAMGTTAFLCLVSALWVSIHWWRHGFPEPEAEQPPVSVTWPPPGSASG